MQPDPIIIIHGEEQSRVDPDLPDAGLPPAIGVRSYCVFRASKDVPEMTDGRGWTYHHHVDMAIWKGRLYVGWNACERDEDIWPSRELFSTSTDGRNWSPPQEMFPQGVSTCLRVYFFLAPNGRMLAIGGLRGGTEKTNEDTKGALVVREIRADHTWADVFTLQAPTGEVKHPPIFTQSSDPGFVEACRSLLADTVFLEQQDRGRLLGDRRMKWHDPANWPGGKVPGDNEKWVAGKAYTFFERPDGAIVGVSKMGWVTLSFDRGRTWQQPAVPPTLVTGKAKVFAHQMSDGKYALVYNPSRRNRFPLAMVRSDDGVNFSSMRLLQGELPIQRYAGADRSVGPQYTRGVSKWADDGSRPSDAALWLVYSMSKEDIWVSRVPVPFVADETRARISGFDDWNLYQPKWARIDITTESLRLEDRDPYDHAAATRVLPKAPVLTIEFTLTAEQIDRGRLEIDLLSKFGSRCAIRLAVHDGTIEATDGEQQKQVTTLRRGEPVRIALCADVSRSSYDLLIGGRFALENARFGVEVDSIHRIVFRTGPFRGIGGKKPVEPGTDRPIEAVAFMLSDFTVARASRP